MRKAVAIALTLVLGVVQSGFTMPCVCGPGAMGEDVASDAEGHSCCHSPPPPGVDASTAAAPCERGCCDALEVAEVLDRPAQWAPLDPPADREVATAGSASGRLELDLRFRKALQQRGPPAVPTLRRLALHQTWRC